MNLSVPAKKNSPLTWAESQQPPHPEHRERIQKANWCLSEPFFSCLGHQKARLAGLQTVLLTQTPASPTSFFRVFQACTLLPSLMAQRLSVLIHRRHCFRTPVWAQVRYHKVDLLRKPCVCISKNTETPSRSEEICIHKEHLLEASALWASAIHHCGFIHVIVTLVLSVTTFQMPAIMALRCKPLQ